METAAALEQQIKQREIAKKAEMECKYYIHNNEFNL